MTYSNIKICPNIGKSLPSHKKVCIYTNSKLGLLFIIHNLKRTTTFITSEWMRKKIIIKPTIKASYRKFRSGALSSNQKHWMAQVNIHLFAPYTKILLLLVIILHIKLFVSATCSLMSNMSE